MAPGLGVVVAVIDDEQILLTKRADAPVWCLPGGKVDKGESLAQAGIREVQEETGLEVELTRLVGTYSRPIWNKGNHSILFEGRTVGGTLQKITDETSDAGYFRPDDLPDDLLWWFRPCIADAFAERPAVAKMLLAEKPFQELSRFEIYTRIESGEVAPEEIVQLMCQMPSPNSEILEVG